MGFVKDILSIVGLGGSKPRASGAAATGVVEGESKKAKAVRAKLLETSGGQEGEELLSGTTKKRATLLGN